MWSRNSGGFPCVQPRNAQGKTHTRPAQERTQDRRMLSRRMILLAVRNRMPVEV